MKVQEISNRHEEKHFGFYRRKEEAENTDFPEIFRKELANEDKRKRDSQTSART